MALTGAALWMFGAIVSFTSMAVAGRAVSGQLDTLKSCFTAQSLVF